MRRRGDSKGDFFEPGNMFDHFGSFGSHKSMLSNIFRGRDPFDDPFFTRPFGDESMFRTGSFGRGGHRSDSESTSASRGILIEEVNSEDEGDGEVKRNDGSESTANAPRKLVASSVEPSVEHPDDDAVVAEVKILKRKDDGEKVETRQPEARGFSFKKVTYGGVDGAYYTASNSRRAGSDGIVLEENKEANMTTGQAEHRISREINDKGHSVTRKLSPDGKVDTTQTLHNLEKEELSGFEESWKGNAHRHRSGWRESSMMFGNKGDGEAMKKSGQVWALPFIRSFQGGPKPETGAGAESSSGGDKAHKKVVRINIE